MQINNPTLTPVSSLNENQKSSLPPLYCNAWKMHNLCKDEEEAGKVLQFDPEYSFALVDQDTNKVYGLFNTLPLSITPEEIRDKFPTYKSVERTSMEHFKPKKINTLLCFSIAAILNNRIKHGDKNVSCSRFMIEEIKKKFPNTNIAVYTRWPSVDMHAHLGAKLPPVSIIENSRPEDKDSKGENVVMVYKKFNDFS